jgi:hypothetical protein
MIAFCGRQALWRVLPGGAAQGCVTAAMVGNKRKCFATGGNAGIAAKTPLACGRSAALRGTES